MAEKKKVKTSTKHKKKSWFPIVAPETFNQIQIGEAFAIAGTDLINRTVEYNLMQLVRDPKKQHISVKFRITDLRDKKAHTQLIKYTVIPASIKRLVRRGKDRIDDSMYFVTSDNHVVQIKPFVQTRLNAARGTQSDIRLATRKHIARALQKLSYESLVKTIVNHELQNQIRSEVNKIHPVKTVEIRIMRLCNDNPRLRAKVYTINDKKHSRKAVAEV